MATTLRIGLVAGETSGDRLGIALMDAIRAKNSNVQFEGVGGSLMIAGGMKSLYPMAPLSVMGLIEPLKNLPALLKIRRGLRTHFIGQPPDIFVGIDAPDFNLGLELQLRRKGITTVHYVSPSVWAWRQKRVKKIARAVDHMLTLLPFEASFYNGHQVPVTFVGHPLADELPIAPDRRKALFELGLMDHTGPIIALLPGSRKGEIAHLGALFLEVAQRCYDAHPDLLFVLPVADEGRRKQIDSLIPQFPELPVKVINGQSHLAMSSADVVLLASGTTALEAMLLKKPMVVSYKTGWLTYQIISRMLKVPYVSLPNLLAAEALVPEFLQREASVENLTEGVLNFLENPEHYEPLIERFYELHRQLQCGASAKAAEVVLDLIGAQTPVEAGSTTDG